MASRFEHDLRLKKVGGLTVTAKLQTQSPMARRRRLLSG
jgi:hypothetical protein